LPKMDKTEKIVGWKILYRWKTLQMRYLAIPLFVKFFNDISLNICIINYSKNIKSNLFTWTTNRK